MSLCRRPQHGRKATPGTSDLSATSTVDGVPYPIVAPDFVPSPTVKSERANV